MDAEFRVDGVVHRVHVASVQVRVGDREPFALELRPTADGVWIAVRDGRNFRLEDASHDTDRPEFEEQATEGLQVVKAPMPGQVASIPVSVGDTVTRRQTVAVVVAMKMENEVRATSDGTVVAIREAEGDQVTGGQPLLEIETESEET